MSAALNDRELATVLAALRYWQRHQADKVGVSSNNIDEDDIATDGGKLEPMRAADIDGLCERINHANGCDYLIEVGERHPDQADSGELRTPTGLRIVSTADTLLCRADIVQASRTTAGTIEVEHGGDTDVDWNSQETAKHNGWSIFVDENGGYWLESQLHIVPAEADESDDDEPTQFRNHYRHCGQEWDDVWSCACNDKCPKCGAEIEPHESEEVE